MSSPICSMAPSYSRLDNIGTITTSMGSHSISTKPTPLDIDIEYNQWGIFGKVADDRHLARVIFCPVRIVLWG